MSIKKQKQQSQKREKDSEKTLKTLSYQMRKGDDEIMSNEENIEPSSVKICSCGTESRKNLFLIRTCIKWSKHQWKCW